MDTIKKKLNLTESEEVGMFEKECPLTRKQRLMAFASCIALSWIISFFAFMFWASPRRFGLLVTLGSMCSLASTSFLIGLRKQAKMAFAPKRRMSAILFLSSMVLTLIAALALKSMLLSLFFVLVQIGCSAWYSLSYIPFAQQIVGSVVKKCFSRAAGGGGAAAA